MSGFSQRLRSEIEYIGLTQKEFAAKAGIKKRALDAYLSALSWHGMTNEHKAEQVYHSLGLPSGGVILKVSPEGSITNNPLFNASFLVSSGITTPATAPKNDRLSPCKSAYFRIFSRRTI